ncbi:MAG: transketolase C-terminal domain-containing protein, partial [Lactobacillus paragasseri]|nr:transketolase C-terminal domain-containing protein [Lactobacillus paragasseri]
EETVLTSVKKTGRLIVIDESNPQCNVAGDIASVMGDRAFDYLDGPIKKVTAPDTPVPFAANLEQAYIPNADKVLDIAAELVDDLRKVKS